MPKIDLVPMSEREFEAYAADSVPRYARDKVLAGQWTEGESLQLAQIAFEEYLPDGLTTPGNFLSRIRDVSENTDVGILWWASRERGGKKIAFICDILIHIEFRRRGYGELALSALEAVAVAREISGIGLHVFGHNPAARALYEKTGYRATSLSMYKELE
jgi:ribosomal protein S18 acetylase RimI-like enzyme